MSVLSDALRTEVMYLDGNPDYPTPPSTMNFLGSAADELDAKDAIIAELVEALRFAKVQARVASGMAPTAAQIHTNVEIDQIRARYELPASQD